MVLPLGWFAGGMLVNQSFWRLVYAKICECGCLGHLDHVKLLVNIRHEGHACPSSDFHDFCGFTTLLEQCHCSSCLK